jgi:hypothetical protein
MIQMKCEEKEEKRIGQNVVIYSTTLNSTYRSKTINTSPPNNEVSEKYIIKTTCDLRSQIKEVHF